MSALKFSLIVVLGTTYFFSTCFCAVSVTPEEFHKFNLLCDAEWKARTKKLCQGIGQFDGRCMVTTMNLRDGAIFSMKKGEVPVCWNSGNEGQNCITGYNDSNDALVWKYSTIGKRTVCEPKQVKENYLIKILEEEKTDAEGSSNADENESSNIDK